MSEITKLYENAGVEKPQINYCTSDNCPFNWKYGICQTKKCPNWATKQSKCYPSFTAEKQIRILNLLCQRRFIELGVTPDDEYFLYDHNCCQSHNQHFNEAVAKFVSMLWQDLTDEEKQQIKEILNEKL